MAAKSRVSSPFSAVPASSFSPTDKCGLMPSRQSGHPLDWSSLAGRALRRAETSLACRRAVVAGHDHPAAAYALSAMKPGTVVVTCGTSLTVTTAVREVPEAAKVEEIIAAGLTIGPGVGTGPRSYVVQGGSMDGQDLSAKQEAIMAQLRGAAFGAVDNAAAQFLSGDPSSAVTREPPARIEAAAETWAEAVLRAWHRIGKLEAAAGAPYELGERVVCGGWTESAAFRRAAEVTAGGRAVRFSPVKEGGCTGRQGWRRHGGNSVLRALSSVIGRGSPSTLPSSCSPISEPPDGRLRAWRTRSVTVRR
jgi:hypothetical protein